MSSLNAKRLKIMPRYYLCRLVFMLLHTCTGIFKFLSQFIQTYMYIVLTTSTIFRIPGIDFRYSTWKPIVEDGPDEEVVFVSYVVGMSLSAMIVVWD